MKRFTDRVARDLGQIADRATPSPTAWEEIRRRIDEQTDEPTMEVIMLDPDKHPSRNRPRPWLMVTAAAAAVLIIVGIVVAASGGDDNPEDPNRVTAVDPGPTAPDTDPTTEGEPGEGEPAEDGDGEDAVAGDPATDEPLATQGSIDGSCLFGPARPNPATGRDEADQDCKFDPADNPPFAETGDWTLALDGSGTELAGALVGGGPDGFAYAGYLYGPAFFVGILPGAGAYEGETVYVAGNSPGDGTVPFHWHIGDGPFPAPEAGPDEEVAEISFECVLTALDDDGSVATFEQSCTYDGDDPRFVPEPETFTLLLDRGDPLLEATPGLQFASAVSDDQTLRNGILDTESVIRWRGVRAGTGDFEGRLVDEVAWGMDDGAGVTSGTIWMTVRAPGQ